MKAEVERVVSAAGANGTADENGVAHQGNGVHADAVASS
jgi:hypothetical protein